MKLLLLINIFLIIGNYSFGQFTREKFEKLTSDFHRGMIITTDGEKIEGLMKVECEVAQIRVKIDERKTKDYPSRKIERCTIDSAEVIALKNVSFYNYGIIGRSLPMNVYAVLIEKGKINCYMSRYTEFSNGGNQHMSHTLYILQNEAGEKLELPTAWFSKAKIKKLKSKIVKFCVGSESLINELEVFKYDFTGIENFVKKYNESQI